MVNLWKRNRSMTPTCASTALNRSGRCAHHSPRVEQRRTAHDIAHNGFIICRGFIIRR